MKADDRGSSDTGLSERKADEPPEKGPYRNKRELRILSLAHDSHLFRLRDALERRVHDHGVVRVVDDVAGGCSGRLLHFLPLYVVDLDLVGITAFGVVSRHLGPDDIVLIRKLLALRLYDDVASVQCLDMEPHVLA